MRWFQRRRGKRPVRGALASQQTEEGVRAALMALLDGEPDRAEEALTKIVRANSDDLQTYLALARLYRKRGEVGRAIRIHQNMLLRPDLTPADRVEALSELALDFHQGGYLQRAIASYEEVLAHDSRHRAALRGLVELRTETGDHPSAIAAWRRLARLEKVKDPREEAKLLVRMAQHAHAEGQTDTARKAAKRALKKDRRSADALVLLGQLEAERGRDKAALAAWRAVPEADGARGADVYPRLEATFTALGKGRDFELYLRGLLEKRPHDAAARIALARVLTARGEADAAVSELRNVLDGEASNLSARVELGRLLLAEHRDTDALKEFGELLEVLEGRGPASEREPEAAE